MNSYEFLHIPVYSCIFLHIYIRSYIFLIRRNPRGSPGALRCPGHRRPALTPRQACAGSAAWQAVSFVCVCLQDTFC